MSKRNSDWYIPPDWGMFLALRGDRARPGHWYIPPDWGMFLVIPCIVVLSSILLPVLAQLKTGDMRALYGFGLGAGVIGVVLLFVARLPLYKQRRFWIIGPMQLDRKHRHIYWLAYVFVAASLLLLGVVWLRTHEN
ncbi:MAG: hypothetical protein ABSF60_15665 [Verrucomicrobiota bacterium]